MGKPTIEYRAHINWENQLWTYHRRQRQRGNYCQLPISNLRLSNLCLYEEGLAYEYPHSPPVHDYYRALYDYAAIFLLHVIFLSGDSLTWYTQHQTPLTLHQQWAH